MADEAVAPLREIVTRGFAKANGLTRYFNGKPCKHGHIAQRWTCSATCEVCALARSNSWRSDNPERRREAERRRWHSDRENKIRKLRAYQAVARDSIRASRRKWSINNRPQHVATNARYQAAKISATPRWADLVAIAEIYAECARVSKATGIKHHVDHIVPLKGKNVCGLHVHWNLQILTAQENCAKNNRMPEELAA